MIRELVIQSLIISCKCCIPGILKLLCDILLCDLQVQTRKTNDCSKFSTNSTTSIGKYFPLLLFQSQICSDSHNVSSLLSEADVIGLYNYYYDNYTLGNELKILIDYSIVSEGGVLFFNYQLISIKNNKFIESNLFWMSTEQFSHSKLNNNTVPLTLFVIFNWDQLNEPLTIYP